MQLRKHSIRPAPAAQQVVDRVVGVTTGPWEDALIFAASSILVEMDRPEPTAASLVREVRTEQGVYTLRGKRFPENGGVRNQVLVTAEPVPAHISVASGAEKLRHRFRLTRKEARVAQLLALYRTNAQIAAELCISPHTARHHTQSVLGKLGVRSRRDVGATLERTENR